MTEIETATDNNTKEVEIIHKNKVGWFDVKQLSATAAAAISATIIGPMTGRREIMAALAPIEKAHEDDRPKLASQDSLWIDYMADCGDGWNASHSVAWLLGRNALYLDEKGLGPVAQPIPLDGSEPLDEEIPETTRLEHGKILILGGDQIYPTASKKEYRERFTNVFKSARFWHDPFRHVYALPGNHDWYDGLVSFVRLFCQAGIGRRWLGAWRTEQHRSYFALELPHGWKLWAFDLSLGDDLDPPQQQYFREHASKLQDGDRVIICLPEPLWLKAKDDPEEQAKLNLILDIAEKGGKEDRSGEKNNHITVPLILTGDSHFYARHHLELPVEKSNYIESRNYVVCGGGGAFGLGTIHTDENLVIEDVGTAELEAAFPTAQESVRERRGVFRFPVANKLFSVMLAGLAMITLWLFSATWWQPGKESWLWVNRNSDLSLGGLGEILTSAAGTIPSSVGLLLWFFLLWAGFAAFGFGARKLKSHKIRSVTIGALHGIAQSIVSFSAIWLAAHIAVLWVGVEPGISRDLLVVAFAFPLLLLSCGFLFGTYLFLSHKFAAMHDQEVFSAQGMEEYKSFLRMRLDEEGLTVYPVGLRRPSRKWHVAPGVEEISKKGLVETVWNLRAPLKQGRLFDPDRKEPLEPHLIEKPFTIPNGLTVKEIKDAA